MQTIDPEKSPSLKHWGKTPAEAYFDEVRNDAYVECGWGRLIFAHTFKTYERITKLMRGEEERMRDIAFYAYDPQLIISLAPDEFFLDPSLTYRFDLARNEIPPADPVNFEITKVDFTRDLEAVNAIYLSHHMVPIDPARVEREEKVTFFAAKDIKSGQVVGCAMGADHVEIFKDSEGGSSLWALAVDAKVGYPGIGKTLVAHILAYYKAKGRHFLDLSVINGSTAIALYEKMGFKQVPAFTIKRKNAINERLYTPEVNCDKLNPYAMIIISEAKIRGVGVEVLDAQNNYFKLTFGGRSIICRESLSELTSAVAMSRCADKAVTHALLGPHRISMPAQRVVDGSDDDYRFLRDHGHIAVKPADGEQGHGISLLVRSNAEMELAIKKAREVSSKVVLESFVEGKDLRIVVINFEVVAAAIRKPAEVVGDGVHTIHELIEKQSRRRALATQGESRIPMDDETKRTVFNAGYTLEDVLDVHVTLQVRKTANLHTGGTIHDVTDELHPALADAAVAIAKTINIPVVGVDLMVKAAEQSGYYFIEANERPGLANHEPRPTAQKFIDMLFPNTRSDKDPS